MVDNSVLKNKGMKQIALRPAVELSYLTEPEQKILLGVINDMDCTPSHAQAIILRKASQDEDLSVEDITDVLCVEKANQTVKQHLSEKLVNMLPPKIRDNNVQINEYLEKQLPTMRKCRQEEKTKKQILRDRFKSGFFYTRPSGAERRKGFKNGKNTLFSR